MQGDFVEPKGGWATAKDVRIVPPPPRERGLLFRAVAQAGRLASRPEVPDIFVTLNVNPGLFWPWLLFATRLMPFGKLSGREREKVILRTAWICRSRYEWGQHVDLALRVGVTDDEIVRITRGPAAFEDAQERALMEACDELCRDRCISDATWSLLVDRYDDARRIELTMLVGHYPMIAGFLNTTGIALEPAQEETLRAFHARAAKL